MKLEYGAFTLYEIMFSYYRISLTVYGIIIAEYAYHCRLSISYCIFTHLFDRNFYQGFTNNL